jgi:hypothetical protein
MAGGKVLLDSHFNYETREDDGLNDDDLARAELYDPDSGTFTLTGKTAYPLLGRVYVSSLLSSGKVLSTLGDSCDEEYYAEVFDPSTETFSPTGNMTEARGFSTATLLPGGKVLIAGRGYRNGGSADLYEPVQGTFSLIGEIHREEGHTATLLPDGSVLLAGGWTCCGTLLASAEIYHPAQPAPSPLLYSLPLGVQGAILHAATQQLVSSSYPAVAGEALEVYGAGLVEGSVIPPQVSIGGRMAEVLFFGDAPGFPGLNQINVRVPSGVASGPAVSVRLMYLGRPSNEVSIEVR